MMQWTKEQDAAVHTLNQNVAVAAGAGAGKTKVLVERYLYILEQEDISCDNILAITFTNKAAAEMKGRIRARMNEIGAAQTSLDGRLRWREFQERLEHAPISTIHSLCARILRENPVEAVLDPGFAVTDEAEAALLLHNAVRQVLEKAIADESQWVELLMLTYGKAALASLLAELYSRTGSAAALNPCLLQELSAPYRQAQERMDSARQRIAALCDQFAEFLPALGGKSAHAKAVQRLVDKWPSLRAEFGGYGQNPQVTRQIDEWLRPVLDARSKDKELVKEIREELQNLQYAAADQQAEPLAEQLAQGLAQVKAALDAYKTVHHVLTFDDMETRTLRLLQDNPSVRKKYVEHFRYILVDEFQDTNDTQRQLVYLLAGGDAEQLRERKLFIVGDPKQSIYRFRGADVNVFSRVTQDIASQGGVLLELDTNFRSVDSLLSAFNEWFEPLMTTSQDQIPFRSLKPHLSGHLPGGCVEFLPSSGEGDSRTAREEEAGLLAGRIRDMVDQGENLVRADSGPRAVRYGDIALLFRAFSDLEIYEQALQAAGIPYYVLGGKGFFTRQEIQDTINLLRVVDNRHNETALAAVLRSPYFLLSDEALLWLKHQHADLWEGLQAASQNQRLTDEQKAAAGMAKKVLDELMALRAFAPAAQLISLALERTAYDRFVLTQFMGLQKYANLEKLMALARDFAVKDFSTLGEFVRYVDQLAEEQASEGEAQIESESGDTVKLMTIHKSKGLQFPVVFLPDLDRPFLHDGGLALFSRKHGLGLKVRGEDGEWLHTACYDAVMQEEKQDNVLEMKRVLYVAMTRAESYLVLLAAGIQPGAGKELNDLNTWGKWLAKLLHLDAFEELPEQLALGAASIRVCRSRTVNSPAPSAAMRTSQPCATGIPDRSADAIQRRIAPVAPKAILGPTLFSASALLEYRHCPRAFYYHYLAGIPQLPSGEEAGTLWRPPAALVGLAIHRYCELLRPGSDPKRCLETAVRETAPSELRQPILAAAAPLADQYCRSSLYQEISALKVLHEASFRFSTGDAADSGAGFHGTMDCVLFYPDGSLGIVDFKTNHVTDAAQAQRQAQNYDWQMALYILGAQRWFQRPVRNARLYFVRANQTIEISPDAEQLRAFEKKSQDICRFVRQHGREEDYPCQTEGCSRCRYSLLCPEHFVSK